MKLKDYEIPQYGLDDGPDPEDLSQYSLKNFDLKAYQLTQKQPDPDAIPAPCDPFLLKPQTDSASTLAAAPETASPTQLCLNPWSATPEQPNEQSFSPAPSPAQTVLNQLAPDPCDVQFGPHFNLQTVSYTPLTPAQQWKMPRWVITMVGLFFGSAAVLMIAVCVALLRAPNPAPTGPLAAPTAPVAMTSAAPAPPASSSPMNKASGEPTRAASAPHQESTARGYLADRAAVRVSRHPSVVRRQSYGPRHVAAKRTSSAAAPQETETASTRPPKDALDQLLSESSL